MHGERPRRQETPHSLEYEKTQTKPTAQLLIQSLELWKRRVRQVVETGRAERDMYYRLSLKMAVAAVTVDTRSPALPHGQAALVWRENGNMLRNKG